MEFKQRLIRKRKTEQKRARKELGMKRVKIRGRKRWISATKKTAEASA